jgi:hypothetical protein
MHVHSRISGFLRPLLLGSLLVLAGLVSAQNKFTINGRLKIDGGDLAGARVVVYKNGEKERVITTGLNKLGMDLDLNASYVLSFEKDGFVSKKLSFNTRVPAEAGATAFTPFDYAVSLFKQYDDLNMVVFNQPVGIIRYEPSMGDFDYDTDYTKSIQAQLQQALAAVEQKQKEEAKNAGALAKQKAAEEKALAKAQADAEKQAAAEAKVQAEAEKQAAAEAKARADAEKQAAAAQALADQKAKEEAAKEEQRKADEARAAEARQQQELARQEAARKEEQKAPPPPPPAPVAEKKPPPPAPQPKPVAKQAPAPPTPAPPPASRPAPATVPRVAPQQHMAARTEPPVTVSEARRSADPKVAQEARAVKEQEEVFTERHEELIQEPNRVTTIIRLTSGATSTEYRRVYHKWGGVFYFKNGIGCTQQVYEREALGEQLAGAARGKLSDR